jgi:hypothetical protein
MNLHIGRTLCKFTYKVQLVSVDKIYSRRNTLHIIKRESSVSQAASTHIDHTWYVFLIRRWIQRRRSSLRLSIVWNPFRFLLCSRVRESPVEVVVSPCINHPGWGRTIACAMIPVHKNMKAMGSGLTCWF